jgi:hypothetical protein
LLAFARHHVPDLPLLPFVERGLLRELRRALLFEIAVIAGVERRLAVLEMDDAVGNPIQEVAIVRDHQQRALIVEQPLFEPEHRVQIEVVGGLVEKQQIGAAHERLRKVDAHAPAAGERIQGPCLVCGFEAQAMHELRGTAACFVAADRGIPSVQFGQPRAVILGFGLTNGSFDRA